MGEGGDTEGKACPPHARLPHGLPAGAVAGQTGISRVQPSPTAVRTAKQTRQVNKVVLIFMLVAAVAASYYMLVTCPTITEG